MTLLQRMILTLAVVLFVGVITTPLFSWGWIASTLAIVLRLASAAGAIYWMHNFVETEHRHFRAVLQDLQQHLQDGERGLTLKSERPQDSFGQLADEINSVVVTTSEELTKQLERNRQLEQDQTLFQSILATMIEGVVVLDSQSRVLYFNRTARRMLDCTARNVEGRPLWEVVRASVLQEAVDHVFESGHDFRKEINLKRSKNVVEATAARLPLQPEPGVVIVLHDVTELRRLERMRREFVSNVSHELKTPLTSIQAYADTLLEGGGLEDQENSRLFVSRILEQSDRLQMLIQDMLRLARIESQSEAFQMVPVVIGEVLDHCVDARLALARSREIELVVRPGGPRVEVLADPTGLQTIVENLVSNALNHTPEGGRIELRWSVETDQVVIEVEDSGVGIPAEHQERIFERFYRVDRARSRGMGGTGLGLAIVKHLTIVFGGDVEVDSQVGRGSLFRVRLPLAESSIQPAQSEERSV